MFRIFAGTLTVLFALSVNIQAEEIRGRIKTVAADQSSITLVTGSKENTYELAKDVKVFGTFAQRLRRPMTLEIVNGLTTLKANTDVQITTEARDNRPQVVRIHVQGTQQAVRETPAPKK